jgi:Lrp/AsnC family transcriptional regulator, leucine-responsive regulatory protein
MARPVELDRINRRILAELQGDARVTNLVLAERVGLSPSACLKRVQALEAAGCIRGYYTVINFDRVADHIEAYLFIEMADMTGATRTRFEAHIRDHLNIVDCMRMGGKPDYIALVYAADIGELGALIESFTSADLNVARADVSPVMNYTKRFEGFPLEAVKWKERT